MNVIVCLFNDTATTDIYTDGHTLSLHDALPISFEPYLMSAECIVELQEEVGIRFDAAVGFGIELDHPALDAVRVELAVPGPVQRVRSEEHTSELQSLMRISYAVFCLNKKTTKPTHTLLIPIRVPTLPPLC